MGTEAIIVPVLITGIVQALKVAANRPSFDRFAPLLAIIIGIVYSLGDNSGYEFSAVVSGIVYGLTSMGLYSGVKVGAQEAKKAGIV